VGRLQAGMPVQVRVEGTAAPVTGRLARIAPMAEPGTRSIGVTIGLDNPEETLRAGQYALARVELADDARRLTVPLSAVGNTSGQEHVWLIVDGALLRRAITTGRRDVAHGRVEVLTGLSADTQVLAARFDNLREGAKAVVVSDRAPRTEAAGSRGTVTR
jgi:membrane fusion protein (multidrug efflux system)